MMTDAATPHDHETDHVLADDPCTGDEVEQAHEDLDPAQDPVTDPAMSDRPLDAS